MSNPKIPDCIPSGVPPCPLCPAQTQCHYGREVLGKHPKAVRDMLVAARKMPVTA